MSLTVTVYAPEFRDSMTPEWVEAINGHGMKCEIHPEFSFAEHAGFLPFKLRLDRSNHRSLINVEFVTGFEFYTDPFNLADAIGAARLNTQLRNRFLDGTSPSDYFASAEIDSALRHCTTVATFRWGTADLFEPRMAMVASAALTEVSGGRRLSDDDGGWYGTDFRTEDAVLQAEMYESAVPVGDHKVHPFEQWL